MNYAYILNQANLQVNSVLTKRGVSIMLTYQALIEASKSGKVCEALKDISVTDILALKGQGVIVLHAVVAGIKVEVNHAHEDNELLNPNYVSLLTKIINADPKMVYEMVEGKTVFELGSKSINRFLLSLGAGIGCKLANSWYAYIQNADNKQPILFVGAKLTPDTTFNLWRKDHAPLNYMFLNQIEYEKNMYVYHVETDTKTYYLTKNKKDQLLAQAEFGKKYAPLEPVAKNELQEVINFLYSSELSTVMLQMVHQVASMPQGLLPELMMLIIGQLLGISYKEAEMLYVKKISDHAKLLQSSNCLQALTLFKAKVASMVNLDALEEKKAHKA